jgi:hypothetical protein
MGCFPAKDDREVEPDVDEGRHFFEGFDSTRIFM